jgi:hypothetical protein
MITPEVFIDSFDSYSRGEKHFCKLVSFSDKNDGVIKYFGFWIEVIRNDNKLVLSLQVDSPLGNESANIIAFLQKKHLETFVEYARQYISNELKEIFARNNHIDNQTHC